MARSFNPRLPCGRRPGCACGLTGLSVFQSTPPMREATRGHSSDPHRVSVSIHASHAGGDRTVTDESVINGCFNPRLPCGRRLQDATPLISTPGGFNPRLPCGRRPRSNASRLIARMFQSTPPMREATGKSYMAVIPISFQSTPPMREATT